MPLVQTFLLAMPPNVASFMTPHLSRFPALAFVLGNVTDGLCPCINAANLALIHAGVSMRDFVVACSAGFLEKTPLLGALIWERLLHVSAVVRDSEPRLTVGGCVYLRAGPSTDLNFAESSSSGPTLPVALLPRTDQVLLVTMDSRLPIPVFKVRVCVSECVELHTVRVTSCNYRPSIRPNTVTHLTSPHLPVCVFSCCRQARNATPA